MICAAVFVAGVLTAPAATGMGAELSQGGASLTPRPAGAFSGGPATTAPAVRSVAAAAGNVGQVASTIGLMTGHVYPGQWAVPACLDPDGIVFDPATWNLYVSCFASNTVVEIDPAGTILHTIKLPPTCWPANDNAWVPVPAGCTGPSALALDSSNGLLYVSTQLNVTVVDTQTQVDKVIGEMPTPGVCSGVGSLVYDPHDQRVYGTSPACLFAFQGTSELGSHILSSDLPFSGAGGIAYDSVSNEIWAGSNGAILQMLSPPDLYDLSWVNTSVFGPSGVAYDALTDNLYQVGGGGTDIVGGTSLATTPLAIGDLGSAITYDPAAGAVVETLPSNGTAVFISDSTNAVLERVHLGTGPNAIAYDPIDRSLYVTNGGSDNLSIFGGPSSPLVATPELGLGGSSLAYDSADGTLIVGAPDQGSLLKIDGGTLQLTGSSPPTGGTVVGGAALQLSGGPEGAALDLQGNLVVGVTEPGGSSGVVVVPGNDTDDLQLASPGALTLTGSGTVAIGVDPASGGIFVANGGSGTLTLLEDNGSGLIVTGTLTLGTDPAAVAVDPTLNEVFVANAGSDNVSVVALGDLSTAPRVVGSVPVGAHPDAVAFDSANGELYVANGLSNNVSLIDAATASVLGGIPVGLTPVAIAFENESDRLYVANAESGNLTVLDGSPAGGAPVLGSIVVGRGPTAITIDGGDAKAFVADAGAGAVSVVSLARLFPVSFTESGLPSGLGWTVNVGSEGATVENLSLSFPEPNGTYSFSVPRVRTDTGALWLPLPSSGSLTVSASPTAVAVQFVEAPMYPVTFEAKGLPVGSVWSVVAGGVAQNDTTLPRGSGSTGSLTFLEPNGTLNFSIRPPGGYGVALLSGHGVVGQTSGQVSGSMTWIASFGQLRTISFVENSLAKYALYPGAIWTVTLLPAVQHGGPTAQFNTSDPTAVEFTVPVGAAYRFSVAAPGPEYRVAPSHGAIRIPGVLKDPGPFGKTVRFVLLTSKVVFRPSGLPAGTGWVLAITQGTSPVFGYPFSERSPGPGGISFRLPAGTYSWVAVAEGFVSAAGSGTIQVSYPSVLMTVSVPFSASAAGCFVFTENGTPLGGPTCNANANDVLVTFGQVPGAVCANQFTLAGGDLGPPQTCPASSTGPANELEINWTGSSSGSVMTSCYWAVSGTPTGACIVPAPPSPNGFVLYLAQIVSVSWSVNGSTVGSPIPAPANANGVVFFL